MSQKQFDLLNTKTLCMLERFLEARQNVERNRVALKSMRGKKYNLFVGRGINDFMEFLRERLSSEQASPYLEAFLDITYTFCPEYRYYFWARRKKVVGTLLLTRS